MHLYETHLPVADTELARELYTRGVGLPFAYRDPTRDIVFLWATSKEQGMIGLWGPGATRGSRPPSEQHLAFAVSLERLFAMIKKLRENGVATFGFGGKELEEPSVIGWMPSAQIYFRDPDGHMLEFITILPDSPRADFIGTYSEWKARPRSPS